MFIVVKIVTIICYENSSLLLLIKSVTQLVVRDRIDTAHFDSPTLYSPITKPVFNNYYSY